MFVGKTYFLWSKKKSGTDTFMEALGSANAANDALRAQQVSLEKQRWPHFLNFYRFRYVWLSLLKSSETLANIAR